MYTIISSQKFKGYPAIGWVSFWWLVTIDLIDPWGGLLPGRLINGSHVSIKKQAFFVPSLRNLEATIFFFEKNKNHESWLESNSLHLSSTCSLFKLPKNWEKKKANVLPQGWPRTNYKWSYGAPMTVGFFHPRQTHLLIWPVIFAANQSLHDSNDRRFGAPCQVG